MGYNPEYMTWNANLGIYHSIMKKQRGISDKGCEEITQNGIFGATDQPAAWF